MPYTKIDTATLGNTTIAAALTGKSHRLVGGFLLAANTTTITIYSGTTALTGAMTLVAGTPLVLPAAPSSPGGGRQAYLQAADAAALVLNLSSNVQISGVVEYESIGS